jgi:hypothetical protein
VKKTYRWALSEEDVLTILLGLNKLLDEADRSGASKENIDRVSRIINSNTLTWTEEREESEEKNS